MLTFYPPLHKDELLYSGHARYAERLRMDRSIVCMDLFRREIQNVRPGTDKYI